MKNLKQMRDRRRRSSASSPRRGRRSPPARSCSRSPPTRADTASSMACATSSTTAGSTTSSSSESRSTSTVTVTDPAGATGHVDGAHPDRAHAGQPADEMLDRSTFAPRAHRVALRGGSPRRWRRRRRATRRRAPSRPRPRPEWQLLASELPSALLSVSGRSPTDIYAVGADKGHGPLVLHFDGKGWKQPPHRAERRTSGGCRPSRAARS